MEVILFLSTIIVLHGNMYLYYASRGRETLFDLSNLNDYEFELLCRDIMKKKLKKGLHTFSRGIDGGIDICDSEQNPTIVIQAKHYINSKISHLRAELKKEIEKVNRLKPRNYYVCTSMALTKSNKDEIVCMFTSYMKNISHVLDKEDISSFLEDEKNQDIVKKHYKLWLCASNVLSLIENQNVFIDCAELMLDIENCVNLFVQTNSYYEARNKLIQNKVIIITGAPGVGKSTISKMLLLFFANDGYSIRYASNNNIADIKKVLSQDPMKKEIILLDDFLGQHYLKIRDSQPNELKTLISFVEKSPNKKLIMNSRITILNEAMQSFIVFRDIMERQEKNKYIIDLDKMTLMEKARILYNHLYFNNLPSKYFLNIKSNRNYFKIVQHKNYNPRIIEYVTKKSSYKQILPEYFINYIIQKLDKPEDVWRDEFRNRLDETDRILVNTLYSLTDNVVGYEELEIAFNKRMRYEDRIDTSTNPFKNSIIRLTNSILKNVEDRGHVKVSVINPSINDYIVSEIATNTNEQLKIVESAQYIEQMTKVAKSPESQEIIKAKIYSGEFLKIKTLKNSAFFYYLEYVVEWNICDKKIKPSVVLSIERAYQNLDYFSKSNYAKIILSVLESTFYNFYSLDDIFSCAAKLHFIIKPMYLNDIYEIFDKFSSKFLLTYGDELQSDLLNVFKEILIEKITEHAQEDAESDLPEITSKVISQNTDYIQEYMAETSDILEEVVWDSLEDAIISELEEEITSCDLRLKITLDDFSTNDMKYYFDISGAVNAVLQEDKNYDDDDRIETGISEWEQVRALFER